MSYTKDYVSTEHDVKYLLTYADNYATGYFRKQVRPSGAQGFWQALKHYATNQGFTTEITLDKSVWVGYIKDYEGGTIMQVR